MKRVDGLGVVLAALFAAVLAGWLVNTLAPHLAWIYMLNR